MFDKIYNNILRNYETNFFPLLTDLVKKIYSNFNQTKNKDECNEFIKLKISQYFDIDMEIDTTKFNRYELNKVDEGTGRPDDIDEEDDDKPAAEPSSIIVAEKHKACVPKTFNTSLFNYLSKKLIIVLNKGNIILINLDKIMLIYPNYFGIQDQISIQKMKKKKKILKILKN